MSPPRRVVVCGAGVMGASVAYFLARRGVAVTVIERTGVACAASGKSGGFLALDWSDGTPRGATLRIGVVEEIAQRAGAARGVRVGSETIEADAVVLAMGPWTSRAARGLRLPAVHGLKGYSVTLAGADVPAHALFVDYRTADGRALEPEIFPRPDGETYVCGMADPAPLPESAEGVEVNNASCEVLARAAGRVSTALAAAKIIRRQACYRPVTDDGLPLIGRIPGVAGAYVATGHGPWGMLNAPATGLALSELIADGAASLVDLRPFDPARRR